MYTSLLQLQKRLSEEGIIELTDDANTGDVNQAIVDQAILDAQVKVDSKLRGRYPVPLSPVPELIEQITAVLALHNLYSRKHQLTMSDGLGRQYKTALNDLDELQTGAQILPGFELASAHPAFIRTNKTESDRYFSGPLLDQMP